MKHILLLTTLFFIVGCNNEDAVNPIALSLMLTELESRIEQLERPHTNRVISASIIKLYNADGMIKLFDEYGDLGWSVSGRK